MSHTGMQINTLDTISNKLIKKLAEVMSKQDKKHFDGNIRTIGKINAPAGVTLGNIKITTAKNKGGFNILNILDGIFTNGNITATNNSLNGYLNIIGWGNLYSRYCGKINYQGKISYNSKNKNTSEENTSEENTSEENTSEDNTSEEANKVNKISQKGKDGNKKISKVVDNFTKKYQNTIHPHTGIMVVKDINKAKRAVFDFRKQRPNLILVLRNINVPIVSIKLKRHQNILLVAEKCNFKIDIKTDFCSKDKGKGIALACPVGRPLCPTCEVCPRTYNKIFYLIIFVLVAVIATQFFLNRRK